MDMGFADYLSRNPSQFPPPPSKDDRPFVINTIQTFKYILLRDTLNNFSADNYRTQHDVIKYKARNTQKTNAFRQFHSTKQSLHCNSISSFSNQSNLLHSNHSICQKYNFEKVLVATRKNLTLKHIFSLLSKEKELLTKIQSRAHSNVYFN